MRTQWFYKYKIHHLLFWVALFAAWYYFRYEDFSTTSKAVKVTAIKVLDLAMMVYLTNYVLIPFLLYKKKYVVFGISFFLLVSISSLTKLYILMEVISPGAPFNLFDDNFKTRVYDNIIPHFLLVSTGAAFKLLLDYAKAQRRMAELAKENAETELSFLKSQINPHFLFNSLNSVYFLIDKENAEARNALHRFSEMLRYQLYEIGDEKISIEKEIGYLKDYITLQQLRKNENFHVSFQTTGTLNNFSIEPLLLVPFVENSFKHVSHYPNKRNEIIIDIHRENGAVELLVRNTTEGKQKEIGKQGGIGLLNVRRRLELLYPNKHTLEVQENAGWFDVKLTLQIDKDQ